MENNLNLMGENIAQRRIEMSFPHRQKENHELEEEHQDTVKESGFVLEENRRTGVATA